MNNSTRNIIVLDKEDLNLLANGTTITVFLNEAALKNHFVEITTDCGFMTPHRYSGGTIVEEEEHES